MSEDAMYIPTNACDWICNCPANDTAERVESELREQIEKDIRAEICSRKHYMRDNQLKCDGMRDGMEIAANIARGK